MKLSKKVDGNTSVYGIIGNPIEHSLSPLIQNTLAKHFDINSVYIPYKINEEYFNSGIEGIINSGSKGFNITFPYKKEILKYAETKSKECIALESANIAKIENGKIHLDSTDGKGFVNGFLAQFKTGFKDKNVLLLGLGSAGKSIAYSLEAEKLGINNLFIKTKDVKEKIIFLDKLTENENIKHIRVIDDVEEKQNIDELDLDIIINATNIGFTKDEIHPYLENYKFNKNQIVVDIVYNPIETKLLKRAKKYNAKTQNGIAMLVFQAIENFKIWNDIKIKKEVALELYEEISKEISKKQK